MTPVRLRALERQDEGGAVGELVERDVQRAQRHFAVALVQNGPQFLEAAGIGGGRGNHAGSGRAGECLTLCGLGRPEGGCAKEENGGETATRKRGGSRERTHNKSPRLGTKTTTWRPINGCDLALSG